MPTLMTSREHSPIFAAPELDRDHENRAALFQVAESARRASTPEDLLRCTLESVRASFGWVYASYFQVTRRDRLEPALAFAFDSGEVPSAFRRATHEVCFTRGEGLAGLAWQRHDFVFVEDVTLTSGFLRAEAARASGIRSGFWVPVTSAAEVIGTIEFFSPERMRPGQGRMAALRAIHGIVATALERVRRSGRPMDQAQSNATPADERGVTRPGASDAQRGWSPA